MTLAQLAWDLQEFSGGRFLMGLGTQVEAHVTRRFSMPWAKPASRMRELILAVRAIWATWRDGDALEFHGEFYRHDLMTPFFTPTSEIIAAVGLPPILLAGVGPRMTEIAGEVCDGFICHGFTTERYLREVSIPALERGRSRAGKSLAGFEIVGPPFVVTGQTDADRRASDARARQQLGFYASTPAYRAVLELHGWGALGVAANNEARKGRWSELGSLIDDEVLDAFAIVGPLDEIADRIQHRYGDVITRFRFSAPDEDDIARWAHVAGALHDR
ncbi:MAG TPA: TIGR03617 family F420-dependent LLM class oxidoreductase, partial [Ilumatobacteraceae bacterium]|nr:TIGR03617 family F420-dependent LLM class oxidoreductase [Ilumatobacteraceae bacterium]